MFGLTSDSTTVNLFCSFYFVSLFIAFANGWWQSRRDEDQGGDSSGGRGDRRGALQLLPRRPLPLRPAAVHGVQSSGPRLGRLFGESFYIFYLLRRINFQDSLGRLATTVGGSLAKDSEPWLHRRVHLPEGPPLPRSTAVPLEIFVARRF